MRQPSLRAAGANHCSSARRNPASAPTRLTSTISPPGLSTRANSSSVASGFGTVVIDVLRHHHVERGVRKRQMLGVHHPESLDIGQAELGDPLLRLAQHRLGNVDAANAAGARIIRQRDAGADADLEDAAADAFGGGDRGLPAALEHRAEHEIIDRRPARIGLGNRVLVELGARQIGHELAPCLATRWRRRSSVRCHPPCAGCRHPGAWRAMAACRHLLDVPDELARAVFPGVSQRECAAGCARNPQRLEAGDAQIVVQHADRIVADDVLRPGDRKGGDRNAAGQRLELHDAERVGPARKHEDVGRRQMRGQGSVLQQAEKLGVREPPPQLGFLRAGADDDLGAGQIEREKCFEVLFDGDPSDA